MELNLNTAKLRAIAFPLETCSSPINAKHIGETNEKKYDMKDYNE